MDKVGKIKVEIILTIQVFPVILSYKITGLILIQQYTLMGMIGSMEVILMLITFKYIVYIQMMMPQDSLLYILLQI